MKYPCVVLALLSFHNLVQGAEILFISTEPSTYYQVLNHNIYLTLRKKGHNITAITTNPYRDFHYWFDLAEPEDLGKLNQIDIGSLHPKYSKKLKPTPRLNLTDLTITEAIKKHNYVSTVYTELADRILSHSNVRDFLKEKHPFDVCVIETFYPAMAAFAHVLNCPFIALSATGSTSPYYSHSLPVPREPTFWNRMKEFLLRTYAAAYYQTAVLPREDNLIRTYLGEDLPYLETLANNYEVMLANVDHLHGGYQMDVQEPNVVDISGAYFGDTSKIMIKSMLVALNESREGIIYVSFGENIETKRFTRKKLDMLLEVFEQLPYYVILKYEEWKIHHHPKNVFIAKENPTNQILENENVKLFITGGDRDAIEETIKYRVPIIGIPFNPDNAEAIRKCVDLGIGRSLNFLNLSAENLNETIHEIMSNSVYTDNVVKLHELFYDQPTNGLDLAVWWIEYIIKHKGNPRKYRSEIPSYQYYSLDIIGALLLCILLPNYLLYKFVRLLSSAKRANNEKQRIKQKKNK